jgi:hypothetical protein
MWETITLLSKQLINKVFSIRIFPIKFFEYNILTVTFFLSKYNNKIWKGNCVEFRTSAQRYDRNTLTNWTMKVYLKS